ncbi:purine and uridine phosphorylase, partial [Thozetella sp. PMI_491]
PNDRSSFRVAVLCALSLEFRAMAAALDMDFTKRAYRKRFGKVEGDSNTYKPGRIGDHDVVIIQLPGSGKESAATASALARVSYPNIKLAFVVGVCAGAPKDFKGEDIILGDVLISTHVFQTDHARIHDSGMKPYENVEEVLGRAPKPIRSFLKACLAEIGTIQEDVEKSVETLLQDCPQDSTYPGREKDKLLENQHRHSETSKCKQCQEDPASCQAAQEASCAKLGCDDAYLECLIGFEMEGAGVWDNIPTVVVKGVSDYADSHKNKVFQDYAAVSAAACAKVL